MSTPVSVWVRLYYQDKEQTDFDPVLISPIPENVHALKRNVHEGCFKEDLLHAQEHKIALYKTIEDGNGSERLKLSDDVPANTNSESPLIVVAPAPGQKTPQNENKDDVQKKMEITVSQWKEPNLFLGKRKRDDEALPETTKKQALTEKVTEEKPTEDDYGKAAGKTLVDVYSPAETRHWYLGEKDDVFFLRSCVKDALSIIMDRISKPEHSFLCVISGASGIGKSWSINAFMALLLNENKKVFFHSGADGRAWKISGDNAEPCALENIQALANEWIYVYDSPGPKQSDTGRSVAQQGPAKGKCH